MRERDRGEEGEGQIGERETERRWERRERESGEREREGGMKGESQK